VGCSVHELFARAWGKHVPEMTSTMTVQDGGVVEHHDTHAAFRSLQAGLFLQHYGLESNVLDLTSDIDIALFFAQHRLANNKYVDVDYGRQTPVIYIFILDRHLDPVVNTGALLETYEVLRPKRQRCGILAGASLISRNYYSRFISMKLNLLRPIDAQGFEAGYLFPGPNEDRFLANLLVLRDYAQTSLVKPFMLE